MKVSSRPYPSNDLVLIRFIIPTTAPWTTTMIGPNKPNNPPKATRGEIEAGQQNLFLPRRRSTPPKPRTNSTRVIGYRINPRKVVPIKTVVGLEAGQLTKPSHPSILPPPNPSPRKERQFALNSNPTSRRIHGPRITRRHNLPNNAATEANERKQAEMRRKLREEATGATDRDKTARDSKRRATLSKTNRYTVKAATVAAAKTGAIETVTEVEDEDEDEVATTGIVAATETSTTDKLNNNPSLEGIGSSPKRITKAIVETSTTTETTITKTTNLAITNSITENPTRTTAISIMTTATIGPTRATTVTSSIRTPDPLLPARLHPSPTITPPNSR
jgi:hypothetical protein